MAAVRVMTWNVQNLFEPGAEDGPETPAAYQAKIASLKQVIDTERPVVLALQEVGRRRRCSRSRPHCRGG